MSNTYLYHGPGERWVEEEATAEDRLNLVRENADHLHEALNTIMDTDAADGVVTGTLTPTGNITMTDDSWIGLGAAAGRIVFDDQATDKINFLACNVGIGTTIPGDLLEVFKDQNTDTDIHINNSNAGASARAGLQFSNDVSIARINYGSSAHSLARSLQIVNNDAAGGIVFFFNGGNNMVLNDDGNVGIGTTGPDKKVEINTGASDNGLRISYNDADGSATNYSDIITGADGDLTITTVDSDGAAGHIALMSDGYVGIGTTTPTNPLSQHYTASGAGFANAGYYTIDSGVMYWGPNSTDEIGYAILDIGSSNWDMWVGIDGGTGVYGNLHLVTGSTATERLTISIDGNVGIGTTTPVSLTEIQGGLTTVGSVLTLGTKETSVVANDILGRLDFYAPLDAAGTDANLLAASIVAIAEGTFSAASNATSLQFRTGASEVATTKMTIMSSGNVGIGTTGPTARLHVAGTFTASQALTVAPVLTSSASLNVLAQLAGTQSSAANDDIFYGLRIAQSITNSGAHTGLKNYGIYVYDAAETGTFAENYGLYIASQTAGTLDYAIYSAGGTNYFGGNVGIGTTAPDKKLEINTGASDNGIRLSYNDADGSATNYTDMITGSDGDLTITTVDSDGAAGHIALMPDGNVGIGTASPGNLLEVFKDQNTDTDIHINNSNAGASARAGLQFSNDVSIARINYGSSAHSLARSLQIVNNDAAGGIVFFFNGGNNMVLNADGSVGIGTTTFDGTAAGVLSLANATAPAAHVDNTCQIYSIDSSDTAATLGFFTEQAVEVIGTFTASHKLKVWINGTEYWIQLDAV